MRKLAIVAKPKVLLTVIAKSGKTAPTIRIKAVTIQTNAYFSRKALRLRSSKININVTSIVAAIVILSIFVTSLLFVNQ
jgi:hypothetical protein